jgi:uncharacterized flavoprotein (TIGR03862 family)
VASGDVRQDRCVPPTVAVVGGGPAGLMAAEVVAAARRDLDVIVFDHMPSVGRKLQLAGRGGLNLTHTEPLDRLLGRYGDARARLEPAVRAFDPDAVRGWSAALGQRAVVGTSGRVFPVAFRATPLLRAWLRRLDDLGVEVRTKHRWKGWEADGGLLVNDAVLSPMATILALGGASWPRTGSDGGWVDIIRAAGIGVAPLRPANGGFVVSWSAPFVDRFAGVPLKTVGVSAGSSSARGDVMITATGIEGGAVYAVGRGLRDAVDADGRARVRLDLRPDVDVDELATRLRHRRPKDSMSSTLRRNGGLTPVGVALMREASGRALPSDVAELAQLIKRVELEVTAAQPIARAISSAGGILLDEVDERFMLRRRPGTFVAGEMLDWEAPTGGYLLQATFSTAVAAAHGALAWIPSL